MQKIEIVALLCDSKKIIERLQRRGIVELTDIQDERLVKMNTSASVMQFEKNRDRAVQALEILNNRAPGKKGIGELFSGKRQMTTDDFGVAAGEIEKILTAAMNIIELESQITHIDNENAKLTAACDSVLAYSNLDVPIGFKGTEFTDFYLGSISSLESVADRMPEGTVVKILSSNKQQTHIAVLCLKKESDEVYKILREAGFANADLPAGMTPGELRVHYLEEIRRNSEKSKQCAREIVSLECWREKLEFLVDYLDMRTEKYRALNSLAVTEKTIVISGYIPEKYSSRLIKELEGRFSVAIDLKTPSDEEDVPVLLENSSFSAPVEGITEMYALPNKRDVDPTPVMSFFYYLFFGMMLSDAGYGILMVLGTEFALRKFSFEEKMKKTLTMFKYCGISTIFWGALFGSWFGDIIHVVAREFFGREIVSVALWFQPLDDPMKLLLFSFGLGICHLFLGLAVNFKILWCEGRKLDAVFDVIPVFLTVLGAAPMAAAILSPVPKILSEIGMYLAIIGVVLIILTAGRSSKSIFARFFGGIYGLYNIATGYLSDILSYSRLLALGLATGSIAGVINLIGTMPSNPIVKAIMLVLVFIVGHTANLAINLLGAYVHTDRLQFVELFSKFYEGGGRAFEPLSVKTKYIKFKEEIINE